MDLSSLPPLIESLWVFAVAPIVGVAGLVATARLKLPQVLRIRGLFRALEGFDGEASGTVHPGTAGIMSAVAAYGGAAAVGAATAVSLGGAGAIVWVWLFALLIAPLRVAEAVLARTSAAGKTGASGGSLAGRLLGDSAPAARVLGWIILVLLPVVGLLYVGGLHGEAVRDAASRLLPDGALPVGIGIAVVAAIGGVMPMKKAGGVLGWIATVAFIALFGVGLFAFFSEPSRAVGSFGRGLSDAFEGAQSVGAFSGALAGEIAVAALLHLLPPLAVGGGLEGAWHAEAQASTTKQYVSAALLGPLLYLVITTLVGFSLVTTNAFSRPVDGSRPLNEITFYRVGFDTVSQRQEVDRLYDGFLRVSDGDTGVIEIHAGTERGMIREPSFVDNGEPGDFAIHVHDGVIDNLQKPGDLGALDNRPISEVDHIAVEGQMLPRGATLLDAAARRAGGEILGRILLTALLLLAALGAIAWGFGVRKTVAAAAPEHLARWAGLLPGVGIGLTVGGLGAPVGALGMLAAGLLVLAVSLALVSRARDAAERLR